MQLSSVQRRIRDFYFKEGLGAPPDASHVHHPDLVPDQQLFSLDHLRRHLNNPLLDLNYLNLFQAGKPVDLSGANLYKLVQKRKIGFVDRRVLQQHLERGAACVLEGLDILEPDINTLADRARSGTRRDVLQCNGFLLAARQRGVSRSPRHRRRARHSSGRREAVEHPPAAGASPRQPGGPRRRANGTSGGAGRDATGRRAVPAQLHASPRGNAVDALASLSFDLCDRQPSIEVALQLLLRHYDRDSSPRATPPLEDLEKLFRLSRSGAYASELAQAQAGEDSGHAEFRQLLADNRITFLDRLLQADRVEATSGPVQPARDTRT